MNNINTKEDCILPSRIARVSGFATLGVFRSPQSADSMLWPVLLLKNVSYRGHSSHYPQDLLVLGICCIFFFFLVCTFRGLKNKFQSVDTAISWTYVLSDHCSKMFFCRWVFARYRWGNGLLLAALKKFAQGASTTDVHAMPCSKSSVKNKSVISVLIKYVGIIYSWFATLVSCCEVL